MKKTENVTVATCNWCGSTSFRLRKSDEVYICKKCGTEKAPSL